MPKGFQGFQKGNKLGLGKAPRLGMKSSQETKKKQSLARLGKKMSAETKKKLSDYAKSIGRFPASRKGKKHTEETRLKMSLAHANKPRPWARGVNHPLWKGGKSKGRNKIRQSLEYIIWRRTVLERDKWTCVWCGKRSGWNKEEKKQIFLQVDHIKPFAQYPELCFVVDNGRALCFECHKKTDTYGNKSKVKI